MSKFQDRYASAVLSGNLRSRPDTAMSDSDVIGAAGMAAHRQWLGIELSRMVLGSTKASERVTAYLAQAASDRIRKERLKLKRDDARKVTEAVLAWYAFGRCQVCRGHGFQVMGGEIGTGRTVLSDAACPACKGTGKKPFDNQFSMERLLIARWLLAVVEENIAAAGAAAMAKLAPRLDL